jgi:aminopeptidase YwaD
MEIKRKLFFILIAASICSPNLWAQPGITASELKEHVVFLSSDSLKGRKSGTKESEISARYIADQFKNYGLKLLGDNGFQYFKLNPEIKSGENIFKISKQELSYNKDFSVLAYSANDLKKAGLVFVSYGLDIQKEGILWNDYKDIKVKGKWVLILRGRPEMKKSNSLFVDYGSDKEKVKTATAKGAIGVIFVTPVEMEPDDKLLTLRPEPGAEKLGIPVVHIKREIADQLISKSGKTIVSIEKQIEENVKPVSFDTKNTVEIKTDVNYVQARSKNVVAYLEGTDPVLKSEYIVIGAHYDHLGMGGPRSGSRKPDNIAVHNGADDNASGVATMLEIAQYFASKKSEIKRSLLFIAFGAEELGLIGSQYYVNNPLIDLSKAKAMFNFDMVGRLDPVHKSLTLSGTGTAKEWEDIFNHYQKKTTIKFQYSKEGFGASDHSSFYSRNIPVIHFFSGTHADYHTPDDDYHLLNYEGQEEISKLAADITFELLQEQERLAYQESGSKERRSMGGELKVTLGIIPGFGTGDVKGLKVEGVTKDRPAFKAGLKVGDIITSMNGQKVSDIYEYMDLLKKLKPGDLLKVEIKRGSENIEIDIQL